MKKKYFMLTLALAAMSIGAKADGGKLNVVAAEGVELGGVTELALSAVDKIAFAGDSATLVLADGTQFSMKLAAIDKVEFLSGDASGIHAANASGSEKLVVRSTNGEFAVEGLADGTVASVYSMGGKVVGRATAQNGRAEFNSASLSKGIYLVVAGKKAIKVVKR